MYCNDKQKVSDFYEHMKLGSKIDEEPNATDKEKVLWTYGFLTFALRKIATEEPDCLILRSINEAANMATFQSIKNNVMNWYMKSNRHIKHHTSKKKHHGDNILDGMLLYASSYETDEKELYEKLAKDDVAYWNYIQGANYASEKLSKWHRCRTKQKS